MLLSSVLFPTGHFSNLADSFTEQIVCGSFTVGWYGQSGNSGRRVKVMCYYMDGTVNLYMRPVEGVTVTVDLDMMKIVGFVDRIKVPVPKGDGTDYRGSQQKLPLGPGLKGITVVQPDGPSFTLDGHLVRYVGGILCTYWPQHDTVSGPVG